MPSPESPTDTRRSAILVAKSAITGAATRELEALQQALSAHGGLARIAHAFTEQGTPPLREVLRTLAAEGMDEILLLPLTVPMEPGFRLWLSRSVARWRRLDGELARTVVRLGPELARLDDWVALIGRQLQATLQTEALPLDDRPPPDTCAVPMQQRRVLVCQGAACNDAGAAVVWGHLRNEQKRLELRTTGVGTYTCKTSCLGPCELGPVLQVWPEGTYYGGVDEEGVDRIVAEHLIGGRVVEALAYARTPGKQRLRAAPLDTPGDTSDVGLR